MKSARYLASVMILLVIITEALSCNGGKKLEERKEPVAEATPVTEMQKLMAEKAFKMPGENNPIMAHKYGVFNLCNSFVYSILF